MRPRRGSQVASCREPTRPSRFPPTPSKAGRQLHTADRPGGPMLWATRSRLLPRSRGLCSSCSFFFFRTTNGTGVCGGGLGGVDLLGGGGPREAKNSCTDGCQPGAMRAAGGATDR